MRYILKVPRVFLETFEVEANSLDEALNAAEEESESSVADPEEYSHTLDIEDFMVQLPSGEVVDVEEAFDLEGIDERIGE